jgi:hypothetical protein
MSVHRTHSMLLQLLRVSIVVLVCTGGKDARADPFRNLGFESAVIGTPINNMLPSSEALPYWANNDCYAGYVGYDAMTLDSVGVSIQDGLAPWGSVVMKPLDRNYSVLLQDGHYSPGGGSLTGAYISQTGDVPIWAKSLTFESDISAYINELQVSINGNVIPFSLYDTGHTVNSNWGPIKTYILDVSAYAGENVTLEFDKLVHDPSNPGSHSGVDLDAITFSTIPAPEPSSLALLAVGVLTLFGYRSYRHCRQS